MRARTGRRALGLSVMMAVVTVASVIGVGTGTGSAAPVSGTMRASATSGRPGDTVTVTTTGCDGFDDTTETDRWLWLRLVTTGADPVMVALGTGYDDAGRTTLVLPDWYDATAPARIVGQCIETDMDDGTSSVAFDYPSIAFDLLPGGAPSVQQITLGRTTVAEGQVIPVTVEGCPPGGDRNFVDAVLVQSGDRTLPGAPTIVAFAEAVQSDAAGTVELELTAVDGLAIEPGPYHVLALCAGGTDWITYEPKPVQVSGSNPVGSILAERVEDTGQIVVAGQGCTGGRVVEVSLSGERYTEEADGRRTTDGSLRSASPGRRTSWTEIGAERPSASTRNHTVPLESVTVTPDADGDWSLEWPEPEGGLAYVMVRAECGDATADGFRYRDVYVWNDSFEEFTYVDRISPTSSPVGGPVTVHLAGSCEGESEVRFLTEGGEPLVSGTTELVDGLGSVSLRAPDQPGAFEVEVSCGSSSVYELTTFETWVPGAPLSPDPVPPAPPATGWPSTGPAEQFSGRIGPIWLPAATDKYGPPPAGMLPASDLAVDIPRPEGDFAIRSVKYDLVDADGMPVAKSDAHLHHFVIANESERNPACPRSTFGLPGEIVAAVGQERTGATFDDPYGLVVDDTDDWAGLYDLMGMAPEGQAVYLTYDFTVTRDLSAIRPLTTYFASATGCSTFTWTVDGSGETDVQSHYITIEEDGLLVGGGGHVHNGGEASELYDDRGRLLCRSELHAAADSGGGHGGHRGRQRSRTDEAVVVVEEIDDEFFEGPPEFYPDDPAIEHISTCPNIDQPVTAGERLRFDAIYTNDRPRSGVMGIAMFFVWEGGGPAAPVTGGPVTPGVPVTPGEPGDPGVPTAPPAAPIPGDADFTG